MIWTTTAWTIPANQALNLNPELDYALVDTERGLLVLAASLVEKCLERYGLQRHVRGHDAGREARRPQLPPPAGACRDAGYDRLSPVYLADYATADDGTGIVHSSPAYGVDDFNSCVAHGMKVDDILNPVQGNGSYAADFPLFGGQNIWKAVPVIIDALRDAGRLFATETITHSYPHCWRHKTPVIYRAAAQWFIRMDEGEGVFTKDKAPQTLRQMALDAIDAHRLLPRERPRPPARHDRQPARLVHQPPAQLGRAAALLPAQGQRRAAPAHDGDPRPGGRHRRAGGIEAWSRVTAEDILGAADAPHYTKSSDILEVWFDSGSTFFHVLRGTHSDAGAAGPPRQRPRGRPLPRRPRPAPRLVPLSLLIGCALDGRAPYRGLLTHGFTVDGQGRKMSKIAGQRHRAAGGEPRSSAPRSSACGWRATDYSGDIAGDDKILARVVDAYRRIRNTLRFLLANTSDFDAAKRRGAAGADAGDRPLGAGARADSCRPRCWRTTRSTSSTRWWPSCRCSAAKTWAPSTSTC